MNNLSYVPATSSTDFGPLTDLDNLEDIDKHYMGMGALVAAIAAAIGSVIYAAKHIRHSECLGSKCDQQVVIERAVPMKQETNV